MATGFDLQRQAYDAGYIDVTAETVEPENVDRLLNQISNALDHAHAEMERIAPSPTAPEPPNEKTLRVPTVVEDLTQILFLVNRLGERIDTAASRLGRML